MSFATFDLSSQTVSNSVMSTLARSLETDQLSPAPWLTGTQISTSIKPRKEPKRKKQVVNV